MKASELKHFEKLLHEKRKWILEKIRMLEKSVEENPLESSMETNVHPYHMAELGTDESMRESMSMILDNYSETLKEIDMALERIAEGRYGICENCGKPIKKERLEAIPYARYCKECSEKLES